MSKTLKTIQTLLQKAGKELDELSPKSLKESDINAAAEQKVNLREKIAILKSEEQQELSLIAKKDAEDKEKRRKIFLNETKKTALSLSEQHSALNDEIEACIDALLLKLKERQEVFTTASFSNFTKNANELLSKEESKSLRSAINASDGENYRGHRFSSHLSDAFTLSANKHLSDNPILQDCIKAMLTEQGYANPLREPFNRIPEACDELLNPVVIPDESEAEFD